MARRRMWVYAGALAVVLALPRPGQARADSASGVQGISQALREMREVAAVLTEALAGADVTAEQPAALAALPDWVIGGVADIVGTLCWVNGTEFDPALLDTGYAFVQWAAQGHASLVVSSADGSRQLWWIGFAMERAEGGQ